MAWNVAQEGANMAPIVAPLRRNMATALPPGKPLRSPSITRPRVSCRPEGGWAVMGSWTGLLRANGSWFGMHCASSRTRRYLTRMIDIGRKEKRQAGQNCCGGHNDARGFGHGWSCDDDLAVDDLEGEVGSGDIGQGR